MSTDAPIQIAFILNNIDRFEEIASSLPDGIQVHVLDANINTLAQITKILESYQDVDSISLFSHGGAGKLDLGQIILDSQNISEYRPLLSKIGASLAKDGDILLYGCEVAADPYGIDFVEKLAQMSGADVAASDDLTGATNKGGNWSLEYRTGETVVSLAAEDFTGTLAIQQVIDGMEIIYVRPGETSYTWIWGTGQSTDANQQWYTDRIIKISMFDVPDFSWYLTRGTFQYSTNGGSSWSNYAPSWSNEISTSGTIWRFVDAKPGNTTQEHIGQSYWIAGASTPTGHL